LEEVRDIDTETDGVSVGSSDEGTAGPPDRGTAGPSDEGSGELEQVIDEILCVLCRERKRDYSESSRSILCRECRQQHLKLRIPMGIRLFLVAILVSFIVSVLMLPPVLANYRIYIDAERNMQAKQYNSACDKYMSLLETYSNSIPITIKASEAALGAQRFGDLAYIFDTYWVGRPLNDSEYAIATEYNDILERYATAMDEIVAIFSELGELSSEQPLDDLASVSEFLQGKLEALLSRDDVDLSLVYYYLGSTSEDNADAVYYLKLATEQDPRMTFPLAFYGNALRRSGDLAEARDVYEKALVLNAEDANAMRGLSVVELLDGNPESALEAARRAYELAPFGLFVPETLIVMLHENGLHDEAEAVLDEITAMGFEADEDFAEYLEGKVTAEEYYMR